VQGLGDLLGVPLAHRRHRARPEHFADDGGILEQTLAIAGQGVQPRRDQPLHPSGHGNLGFRVQGPGGAMLGQDATVLEEAHELLCIQRVAP
jgi:hypothetical protein